MFFDEFFGISMKAENDQVNQDDLNENPLLNEDPFTLEWVFGYDPTVKIVNLTKSHDNQILGFATSNVCCLYNIVTKECESLMGHLHHINSIGHDQTGRFLVTADRTCVNIWDRECESCLTAELIRTMEHPHQQAHLTHCAMSYDGKSIITVDNQHTVKFWLWSFGKETADDEISLNPGLGHIQTIKYSPNPQEYTWFCVTTDKHIIFINFDVDKQKLISHTPESKLRHFIDTTYVHNDHRAISITTTGYGVIWSDGLFHEPGDIVKNTKNFVKSIKLADGQLNAVHSMDGFIAVAMASGWIKFYDFDLRFMHVLEFVQFDSIRTLAFNLVERKYVHTNQKAEARQKPILDDGTEVWYAPQIPRDATLDRAPITVRDFIVATTTGRIEQVNFIGKFTHSILYRCPNYITHFDMHPTKPWICLGNKDCKISIYDMESKQIITEVLLPPLQIVDTVTKKTITVRPAISCLSYSRSSNHLFCGLIDGSIWLLDPVTAIPLVATPLTFTYSQINKLKFNDTGKFLAYSDRECYLNILVYENCKWNLIGRYREHARQIIACLWLEQEHHNPRLVTIGEDRVLVEYDVNLVYESFQTTGEWVNSVLADVCNEYVLTQCTAIISAMFIPSHHFVDLKSLEKHVLLTTDTFYKIKLYDSVTFENLHTIAGPLYDSPLIWTKYLNLDPNYFIVFATYRSIGIQVIPMNGNPYGKRGMIAASSNIQTIRLSFNNKYLFTLEENDYSVKMWKINPRPVIAAMEIERPHLEPFCHMLPGGKDGWLFKEIQDYFYYMQILCEGLNTGEDVSIGDLMPVTEVVDFMRGIGFFPSEYQIANLMNECTRTLPGERPITHVSFRTIFKLYVNHRPIEGYRVSRLKRVLKVLYTNHNHRNTGNDNEDPDMDEVFITKEELVSVLVKTGEPINETLALVYLKELLLPALTDSDMDVYDAKNIFELLPNTISLKYFITNLLGMPIDDEFVPVFNKVNDPSELEPLLTNKLKINLDDL